MTGPTAVAWCVRSATIDDADSLALIGAATFLETFAGILDGSAIVAHCARVHSPEAYRALLGDGAKAWLATVTPGDAPVGFALVAKPDLPGAIDGDVELKRIYTLSRLHGTGVGAALMDAVFAATGDAKRMLLGVYTGNARAIAFYGKHGFQKIADRQFNVGGKLYDDTVLARSLGTQHGIV